MRQGERIPHIPQGKILGRKKANLMIDAINAFLNLKVVSGDKNHIQLGDDNAVLTLLNAAQSAVSASSDFFHPFKVYHVDGQPYNVFQVRGGLFEHRPWYELFTSEGLGSKVERPIFDTANNGSDGINDDYFSDSQDAGTPEEISVDNTGDWTVSDTDYTGRFVLDTDLDDEGAIHASFWLEITEAAGSLPTVKIKCRMWANFAGTTGRTGQIFPDGPLIIPIATVDPRDPNIPASDPTDLLVTQIRTDHALDRYAPTADSLAGGAADPTAPMRFRGFWEEGDSWNLNNKVMYPGDMVAVAETATDSGSDTTDQTGQYIALGTFIMSIAPSSGVNWIKIAGHS